MLVDNTEGYLDEVRRFADEAGLRKDLEENLDYLANYAGTDTDLAKTKATLTKDFAPHSFYVVIETRRSPAEPYKHSIVGGLIFQGNGGAPAYAVNVGSVKGWAFHT